ncbi:hypothetical protein H8959_022043 [Pygathrix nigripes]
MSPLRDRQSAMEADVELHTCRTPQARRVYTPAIRRGLGQKLSYSSPERGSEPSHPGRTPGPQACGWSGVTGGQKRRLCELRGGERERIGALITHNPLPPLPLRQVPRGLLHGLPPASEPRQARYLSPERKPWASQSPLQDTGQRPWLHLLHRHSQTRPQAQDDHPWPSSLSLFGIKSQTYIPGSLGHWISVLQKGPQPHLLGFASALLPRRPHDRSRSPSAALTTVPGHPRVALRGASAGGERSQAPHRSQNTMSWSLQPGAELRLRVALGTVGPNSHKSRGCCGSAGQTPLPRGRIGGDRAALRLREQGPAPGL